jgi:hypothetical protein
MSSETEINPIYRKVVSYAPRRSDNNDTYNTPIRDLAEINKYRISNYYNPNEEVAERRENSTKGGRKKSLRKTNRKRKTRRRRTNRRR